MPGETEDDRPAPAKSESDEDADSDAEEEGDEDEKEDEKEDEDPSDDEDFEADEREPAAPDESDEADEIVARVASRAGAETCSVTLQRRGHSGTFLAAVTLGEVTAPLVFDTGATLTVITRELADDAGLTEDHSATIVARTANGATRFTTTLIDELVVGDLVATDIRAAICDDCGAKGMAGLLGLDVQRQLSLSLDVTAGIARYPCE